MTDSRTYMPPHPLTEYADPDIIEVWTDAWRFRQERKFWLIVMEAQSDAGAIFVPAGVLDAYRDVASEPVGRSIMDRIRETERITKHDVKARVEVFNRQAATTWAARFRQPTDEALRTIQFAHAGLTSADIVDNISLIQMAESTLRLKQLVEERGLRSDLPTDLPTQVRLKSIHELLGALHHQIPFRGLKGPVGTQQDLYDLFGADEDAIIQIEQLEQELYDHFGLTGPILTNVGQVYPRSIDSMVVSYLQTVVNGAQPWHTLLNGYARMATEYSGDQWNEGDVSTSVIRRVALPGMFMAASAFIRGVEL